MTTDTKTLIIKHTRRLFSQNGYENFSMRSLAGEVGIAASVLYHHFADKDAVLREVFDSTNTALGKARNALPETPTARDMLRSRILFQLDHAEAIVFVLKYYLLKRNEFPALDTGFVPEKAYLHIQEVLQRGVSSGEFNVTDIPKDAKVITHAINGFLLEYYPAELSPKQKNELVDTIADFVLRAIQKGGEK